MKKIYLLFFLLCFTVTMVISRIITERYLDSHHRIHFQETFAVQKAIQARFTDYLRTSSIIGLFAANHFSENPDRTFDINHDEDYLQLSSLVTESFSEMIGLNLIDHRGKIVKVYPEETNEEALNKITQNYEFILKSVKNKEPFWLSPPFQLFQGTKGLAFYVPIFKRNDLVGWIVAVISTHKLFSKLRLDNFLDKYHLLITDTESGRHYFSSADHAPKREDLDYSEKVTLQAREIEFLSWPQKFIIVHRFPWYLCFFISFVFSALATYTFRLYLQRAEAIRLYTKINNLIKFTASEASLMLIGIYKELNLLGSATGFVPTDKIKKYIAYISALLDQISLTEKFSHPATAPEFELNDVRSMLEEELELFKERLQEKEISVSIEKMPNHPETFQVWSNKWLLCHSVLGSLIRNILFIAVPQSELQISIIRENNFNLISFTGLVLDAGTDKLQDEVAQRSLSIAKEVIKLSQGEVQILEKPKGHRTIILRFPIKS